MKKFILLAIVFSSIITGCTSLRWVKLYKGGEEFVYRESENGFYMEIVLGDKVYIPVATPNTQWCGEVYGYYNDSEGDWECVLKCREEDPEKWLISVYDYGTGYVEPYSECTLWKEENVIEHPDWIDPNSISINW